MARKFAVHQILVLGTTALAVSLFAALASTVSKPASLALPTPVLYPTIGKAGAKVEVLVFEDFRCSGCRKFHETVFPALFSRYVESGIVRCTFVPLGFLEGSKPLANAAMAVYKLSPERFTEYTSALFKHFEQGPIAASTDAILLEIAAQVGGIDLARLQESIATKRYYEEIDQNLDWAKAVMGKRFRLPAVYVNGAAGSPGNLEALERLIKEKHE